MTIDRICQMTTKPDVLNALHACRPGHPLNNSFQWRNAYALVAQQPSYKIDGAALDYLKDQANREAA